MAAMTSGVAAPEGQKVHRRDRDGARRFCRLLVRRRGCPGLLALKPWRLGTTRPSVAVALREQRCRRDHPHGSLSGAWALRSGHYTVALCRFVLCSLRVHVARLVVPLNVVLFMLTLVSVTLTVTLTASVLL